MRNKLLGFDQRKQTKRNIMAFATVAFYILGMIVLVMFCLVASVSEPAGVPVLDASGFMGWIAAHRATLLYVTGSVITVCFGTAMRLYKKLPDATVNRWLATLEL